MKLFVAALATAQASVVCPTNWSAGTDATTADDCKPDNVQVTCNSDSMTVVFDIDAVYYDGSNELDSTQLAAAMADIVDQERTESEEREINKLDTKFTNFDKLSDEKVAADAIKLRNERKKQLEREMLQFEEEKDQFEDDFEEMKTEVIKRNVGKLDNSMTKFDSLEQQREQERLQQLKLNRMEAWCLNFNFLGDPKMINDEFYTA